MLGTRGGGGWSFREQPLPCLLGRDTRPPSAAVGKAKPGRAQESPHTAIPTWGQGPHPAEPRFLTAKWGEAQ